MNQSTHPGGCLCGAVRYTVQGDSVWKCLCYCESCCRAAGAPVVAWAGFSKEKFKITHGNLVHYASSANALRGFCGVCGTTLTYEQHPDSPNESTAGARANEVFVTTITLDDPEAYPPNEQVFAREKPQWMQSAHSLPHSTVSEKGTDCCTSGDANGVPAG